MKIPMNGRINIRKCVHALCIVLTSLLLHSCVLQSGTYLEPYRPGTNVCEDLVFPGQNKIRIVSNRDYPVFELYDLYESGDDCMPYAIRIYADQNTENQIELVSVDVTECGNPLPFSVFHKIYPGNAEPELVSFPSAVRDTNHHTYFVKIKKRPMDIAELTITYQINVNGSPVKKEHRYRKKFSIYTKHHTLFEYWLRDCK